MTSLRKKKTVKIIGYTLLGISAAAIALYFSGKGFLLKALKLNLSKGSITPSVDDHDKFPFNEIKAGCAHPVQEYEMLLDRNLSQNLSEELKKTKTSSLLIMQSDKILYEMYDDKHNAASLLNSFSMAKGILSVLVGCALDDGFLVSEDQKVSDFITRYKEDQYGKYLSFKHLMTMEAGFDWEEEYRHPFAENSRQYFTDDLTHQALDVEFKMAPGKKYQYQSISAQVLGIALRKAIGKNLAEYLSEKIWIPLRMQKTARWSTDEKGTEKAFCCIHATSRDFAALGQMVMNLGVYNDARILSESFCRRMLKPSSQNDAFCYNIWTNNEAPVPYHFFYGFLGQFIIMIPKKNIVIVKTGFYNNLEVDKKLRPKQVQMLVDECIAMI